MNCRFLAQRLGEHRVGFLCVLQDSVLKRFGFGSWFQSACDRMWPLSMNRPWERRHLAGVVGSGLATGG